MLFLSLGKTVTGNRDQRNWVAAASFALKNASVWWWGHSLGSLLETFNSHIKWKKHKTVNTHRYFLQFREVSPKQIIDWIQACIAMWPAMKTKWQNGGFARSLCPAPFMLYTCDVILQSLQTQQQQCRWIGGGKSIRYWRSEFPGNQCMWEYVYCHLYHTKNTAQHAGNWSRVRLYKTYCGLILFLSKK